MYISLYLLPSANISHKQTGGRGGKNTHTHTDTQIKWLNTVQSFKVFWLQAFLYLPKKKKKKKPKCFHSSNQTALTSYLNSSDRLPVMLCANTKGEKIYIDIKKKSLDRGCFLFFFVSFTHFSQDPMQ